MKDINPPTQRRPKKLPEPPEAKPNYSLTVLGAIIFLIILIIVLKAAGF